MADDIVTRLRHIAWAADEGAPYADAARAAADEIERLRAAGDAMHEAIRGLHLSGENRVADVFAALDAWQEARRG